jgi:hypothetical protein
MNRVTTAIEKLELAIPLRISAGLTTQAKVDDLHKSLDMPWDEYVKFQELKSAYAGSKLTVEEAQTIYGFLGNTPEHFNKQSVAVKSVLTQIFLELIKSKIGALK